MKEVNSIYLSCLQVVYNDLHDYFRTHIDTRNVQLYEYTHYLRAVEQLVKSTLKESDLMYVHYYDNYQTLKLSEKAVNEIINIIDSKYKHVLYVVFDVLLSIARDVDCLQTQKRLQDILNVIDCVTTHYDK